MSLGDQLLTDEKLTHLLTISKMCAPEYNTLELSDRTLVLDVMRNNWDVVCILNRVAETKQTPDGETMGARSGKRKLETAEESAEESQEKRIKQVESEEQTVVDSLVNLTGEKCGNANAQKSSQELACEHEQAVDDFKGQGEEVAIPDAKMASDPPESPVLNEPLRQHKINVHSLWLSLQSQYFRSLLHSSGMKENYDKEVHIKIPESEENAHLILLEALYHGDVLCSKTVPELLAVLELTDKYDAKFLFDICKYILQKNATTFAIATEILHVIKEKQNMNDVDDLAATLQLVLAKEFSPLDENWQNEEFITLSKPSVKYLLSSDDLIVQSENTVFHALMYWMELNEIDPVKLDETSDLLKVVRFELATIDYLYNVIKKHPTARKMPFFDTLYLRAMTYHAIPEEQKELLREKPTLRKKPDRTILQNICVIKEQDYNILGQKKKVFNNPNEFWACGYKMSVGLIYDIDPNLYGNPSTHFPRLNVRNLNDESLVPLQVSIGKNKTFPEMRRHTFTKDSNVAKYTACQLSSADFSDGGSCELYVAIRLL